MNLQQVLSSFTLSDSMGITREEKTLFLSLMQDATRRPVKEKDAELIFDVMDGKEEVAWLEKCRASAIKNIDWAILLGSRVDISMIEKQTTLEHFIRLVLQSKVHEESEESEEEYFPAERFLNEQNYLQ